MSERLKIVFMGTPDFAAHSLRALVADAHCDVVAAYTQPPRPKGRGQGVTRSPVHVLAEEAGIPVFTPASFKKDPGAVAVFAGHGADAAVVAAYGLILPENILSAPRFGCLNIHASILPRWRGASPIQHAIWHGDAQTGITIMQMDKGLDTGPMIDVAAIPITPRMTAPELHDELAALGAARIGAVLAALRQQDRLDSTAQDSAQSTYAPLLTKDMGRIDFSKTAVELDRQVRALNPWPGTYAFAGEHRLRVLAAVPAPDGAMAAESPPVFKTFAPGTVIDRDGMVSCGNGTALRLVSVQFDGGKPMAFDAAVNGGRIKQGDRLA